MMRMFFVQLIPGLLILTLQNVLAARIHSVVFFCDVLIIFLALQIFFARDNQWLFISAFILGFVVGVWSGRTLGFDALFYGGLAFLLHDVKKVILMHLLTFLTFVIVLFVIKFLFYLTLGVLLHQGALYSFAMNISFLYMMLVSLGISFMLYVVMQMIRGYMRRYHE